MPKQITPPKVKKAFLVGRKSPEFISQEQIEITKLMSSQTGNKKDEGKIRMSLIPPELLTAVGTILTLSANSGKYEARNWELGMEWCRVYDALIRHLNAWLAGESIDPESGKSHLWHSACNIAFLIAYEERKIGVDNRPK